MKGHWLQGGCCVCPAHMEGVRAWCSLEHSIPLKPLLGNGMVTLHTTPDSFKDHLVLLVTMTGSMGKKMSILAQFLGDVLVALAWDSWSHGICCQEAEVVTAARFSVFLLFNPGAAREVVKATGSSLLPSASLL